MSYKYADVIESQDAAADISTAYLLPDLGVPLVQHHNTAQGRITTPGDRDWYRVHLGVHHYTIALTGTSAYDLQAPALKIYDSAGREVPISYGYSLEGNNIIAALSSFATGTYYIEVSGNGGIGEYTFDVSEIQNTSWFTIPMTAALIDRDRSWSARPATGVTVTYGFRLSNNGEQDTFSQCSSAEISAIEQILGLYSDVCGIKFQRINPTGYTDNATILFANYQASDGHEAYAILPRATGTARDGDVWINSAIWNEFLYGRPLEQFTGTRAYWVLMHEIGHAVGLDHPINYDNEREAGIWSGLGYNWTIMAYVNAPPDWYTSPASPFTLLPADIYQLQQMYGVNSSTRVGDTVYGVGSNAGPSYAHHTHFGKWAIWDAGGNDTINCTGFTGSQRINLADGSLSSITSFPHWAGSSLSNVYIAVGTVIENAFGGEGRDEIVGNEVSNVIRGGGGDDYINGLGGDDVLYGDGGVDHIFGGAGNDIIDGEWAAFSGNYDEYLVVASENQLWIVDSRPGSPDGRDEIISGSLSFRDQSIDRQTALASAVIITNVLTGNELANTISGTDDSDQILGRGGDDVLLGSGGTDDLLGGAGKDVLDGGEGFDVMSGGGGDDVYIVDDLGDRVLEGSGEGLDTVKTSISFAIGSDIERLVLTGTGDIDGTGNSLANSITGNSGQNILDGGAGNDTLAGGVGDDTYVVDSSGDVVIEATGAGIDRVHSFATVYTLTVNVEGLALLGDADISGVGNALDNEIIGNAGHNTIDGGKGVDTLVGGLGDDTYVVDNLNDSVVETSDEGYDTIKAVASYMLPSAVERLILLGTSSINGTGNDDDNTILGNAGANRVDGRGGADEMRGGRGNDTYVVDDGLDIIVELVGEGYDTIVSAFSKTLSDNIEALKLVGEDNIDGTGNALVNTITGNSGDNRLDGGAGADRLIGGAGNDTYVIDNAGDKVTEAANPIGGLDTVRIESTYSAAKYTLAANVEDVELDDGANPIITGNALANTITGNAANNTLKGGAGDDVLRGDMASSGGPHFFPKKDYSTNSISPLSIALGDIDNDGKMDAITANQYPGTVSILRGNGDGSFQPASNVVIGSRGGLLARRAVLGDLNGDGRLDLIIAVDDGATAGGAYIAARLGNGDGTFKAETAITTGRKVLDITLGDVNGDGKADLANLSPDNFTSIRLGNGDGTFKSPTPVTAGQTTLMPVGNDVQINTNAAGFDAYPAVAALSNGGFVVTWSSTSGGGDSDGWGVYAQRYTADGTAIGNAFCVNTHKTGSQFWSSVVGLAGGGFVVTWTSMGQNEAYYNYNVYAQIYSESGTAVGGEFCINTTTENGQSSPSVTGLADGGFVATWQSSNAQDGSGFGVYGQRYTANGTRIGGEFQINTYWENSQEHPSVAALTGGGFVVVWSSGGQDGSIHGIYGQRYSANGTKVGNEFPANPSPAGDRLYASVAGLPDGGFVVTWSSLGEDGSGYDICGQRYAADGARLGSEFRANTERIGAQKYSSVVALADGGFVVTWSSQGQDGSGWSVYGRRFAASGTAEGTEFRINQTTGGDQITESFYGSQTVVSLPSGKLVQVWSGVEQGPEEAYFRLMELRPNEFQSPVSFLIKDFNADGKADLAFVNRDANSVSVLLGNGNGTFQNQTTYATQAQPLDVSSADVNGDGRIDLVVANSNAGTVSVLLGTGGGAFGSQAAFSAGVSPHSSAIADVNGDGLLDIMVSDVGADALSVLLGRGDGTFLSPMFYPTGVTPIDMTAADINGDGSVDVVTSNRGNGAIGSGSISVLLGKTTALADTFDGQSSNDVLDGGAGNDILIGGPGLDTLSGGSGMDMFQYLDPADGGDIIKDYSSTLGDRIEILGSAFGVLTAGPLDPALFEIIVNSDNTGSGKAATRFFYDVTAHKLFWDPDGANRSNAVLLATFSTTTTLLSASDIKII